MLGGDLDDRLEPELVKFEHAAARPFVVGLVDRHDDRRLGAPQMLRDLLITGNQPFPPVDDKHNDISGFQRTLTMNDDQFVQGIRAGAEHSAGVDQGERGVLPVRRLMDDIPGRAGDRRDDRSSGSCDAIEDRRLADVRPADEHDRWAAYWAFGRHVESVFSRMLDSVSADIYDSYKSSGAPKHDQS